jgi:hypothetical protein
LERSGTRILKQTLGCELNRKDLGPGPWDKSWGAGLIGKIWDQVLETALGAWA